MSEGCHVFDLIKLGDAIIVNYAASSNQFTFTVACTQCERASFPNRIGLSTFNGDGALSRGGYSCHLAGCRRAFSRAHALGITGAIAVNYRPATCG
jgi:hypothetical protein